MTGQYQLFFALCLLLTTYFAAGGYSLVPIINTNMNGA